MKKITLSLPDSADVDEKEVLLTLAVQFYDKGKLSLGQASELAGLTKAQFMEILGNYGVSIFGETIEDIRKDLHRA